MKNILIVLPYSGKKFTGGLAVFNEELTKALVQNGNSVRLLTMRLADKFNAQSAAHGGCDIVYIEHEDALAMKDPGGSSGEQERNRLYELINSPDVLLTSANQKMLTNGDWTPDLIIGHSRFSGPATILLKQIWFPKAKVEYFLHSIPVEGSVLTGYEAYEENIDADLAKRKFDEEKKWMPKADVVVAVGPLIRAGATMILEEANAPKVRVHECIGGTEVDPEPVKFQPLKEGEPINLLLLGRASAPIKGLEDIILAASQLRDLNLCIRVRGWSDKIYGKDDKARTVKYGDVQSFVDGVLGLKPEAKVRVEVLPSSNDQAQLTFDKRKSHAMLMPSYIEHFGLVPFEALAHGVPVLVNEVSGAGMFLGDTARFPEIGPPCVVKDFYTRPTNPALFLKNVPKAAFDNRPNAWAKAIRELVGDLPNRFENANQIREKLKGYSWRDCAKGVVAAAEDQSERRITAQGPDGKLLYPG